MNTLGDYVFSAIWSTFIECLFTNVQLSICPEPTPTPQTQLPTPLPLSP